MQVNAQETEAKLADVLEQLRFWIWEQIETNGDDLMAIKPSVGLILNKIDELRDKLEVVKHDFSWLSDMTADELETVVYSLPIEKFQSLKRIIAEAKLAETTRAATITYETDGAVASARQMLELGIDIQATGEATNNLVAGIVRSLLEHIDEQDANLNAAIAVGRYAARVATIAEPEPVAWRRTETLLHEDVPPRVEVTVDAELAEIWRQHPNTQSLDALVLATPGPTTTLFRTDAPQAQAVPFVTCVAGDGEPYVKVQFHNLADAQQFHADLMTGKFSARLSVEATHRHRKSGHLVRVIGEGKIQSGDWHQKGWNDVWQTETDLGSVDMKPVVIYEHGGSLWVRPSYEFEDGRFEATPPRSRR